MKFDLFSVELTKFCKDSHDLIVVYALYWDGKPYVGSTSNMWARMVDGWRGHLRGKQVTLEILEIVGPEARYEREQAHIYRLGSYADGHNKTPGGKPGSKRGRAMSAENKAKLLAIRTGFKFDAATKARMSVVKEGGVRTAEGQSNLRQFAFTFPHPTY